MARKRERATAVGLIAVSACFMVAVFWAFTRESETTCLTYGLGLFFAGTLVCLVAGFIGAVVLAVLRAVVSTFLLVVTALATMATLGTVVGYLGSRCAASLDAVVAISEALAVFVVTFGAAGFAATLGSLVGDFLVRLRDREG